MDKNGFCTSFNVKQMILVVFLCSFNNDDGHVIDDDSSHYYVAGHTSIYYRESGIAVHIRSCDDLLLSYFFSARPRAHTQTELH